MATSDYDEELETNPFFVSIRRDFSDLFQQSLSDGYVLAIPRRGFFDGITTFEREEVSRHILIASDDFLLTRFQTSDGVADVAVDGESVKVLKGIDSDQEEVNTRILFRETYYDEDMNKLQLWCVAAPFMKFQREKSQDSDDPLKNPSALLLDSSSVNECVDFLRKFVGGQPLVIKIEHLAKEFERALRSTFSDSDSDSEDIPHDDFMVNEANGFYKSSVNAALSFPHVKANPSWHPTIALAVETYFLHCANRAIFQHLAVVFANDDAMLNRFLRHASISRIDPSSLGIRPSFHGVIPRARRELVHIIDVTTPRAKLDCLNRCFSTILHESEASEFAVSADDLLPTLIFILTKYIHVQSESGVDADLGPITVLRVLAL